MRHGDGVFFYFLGDVLGQHVGALGGYGRQFQRKDGLGFQALLFSRLVGQARLQFLRRVREERKFDSPEALKSQILRDVTTAQTYFRRLNW